MMRKAFALVPSAVARRPRLALAAIAALAAAAVFAYQYLGAENPALLHIALAELLLLAGFIATIVVAAGMGWGQAFELRRLVATDPLTGLANHRGYHEALRVELDRASHEGTELSLVIIDLDDFKVVNDEHGHPYGDEVLRGIGERLRSAVRDSDIAARIGGEEFGLVLPRTGSEAAYEVAERARAAIARLPVPGSELSSSAGIATYPADAEDADNLVHHADGALYWAKNSGKRRTRRFDPELVDQVPATRYREEVERLLREPGALESAFQPVVSLSTGRVVGYEALARFPGARPPAAWFALAHACGSGRELEAAAIRAALEPLGRPPGTHLALNVSPSVLISTELREALPRDLAEVVIEVTEHEAITEDAEVAGALEDLRERGARIAIDDAGAGYSGLKQLVQVQPCIVKIDRKLTERVHADPARMALIESFVRFARRTGSVVCAEGIETLEELAALAELDVAWGQGFALGPPAAPWSAVAPTATSICRAGLSNAMRAPAGSADGIVAGDRGLDRLSARIGDARTRRDLYDLLPLLATELGADEVGLSRWHRDEESVLVTLAETVAEEREYFVLSEFPVTERVLRSRCAAQVLVGDPGADPSETELLLDYGCGSLLIVPLVHAGESVGVIEVYLRDERPFARVEISRARIIANQFAALFPALFGAEGSRSGVT